MKLDREALLEILDIVRKGLMEMTDISELLRTLDLEKGVEDGEEKLCLTQKYKDSRK